MRTQGTAKEPAHAVKKYQAQNHASEERERLILEHLPQVRLIARRIHERLPDSVNLDDLISTGTIGLIAAIDRFDPAHNVKLKTYAEYKIRGAILDSLRGLDWAPRQQRKRSKQIEAAIAAAEQRLHRAPTEDEIARTAGLDAGGVSRVAGGHSRRQHRKPGSGFVRMATAAVCSSAFPTTKRTGHRAFWNDPNCSACSPTQSRKCRRTERTVISLYYHEELTLREISKVVNLHESRVSQLKSQAILRLRSYMEKRWPAERGA